MEKPDIGNEDQPLSAPWRGADQDASSVDSDSSPQGSMKVGRSCAVIDCDTPQRLIRGYCGRHYQQLMKYGVVNPPGLQVRERNPSVCSYPGCEGVPKAKGYCPRHYVRFLKYGSPSATQQQEVNPYVARSCPECGTDISGMRSNAVYCSRTCKSNAASKRAYIDGRGRIGDTARYLKERDRRIAGARAYYYQTRERRLETSKIWREANPDKRAAMGNNRRARKYGNPGYVGVSGADWAAIKRRANGTCTYCGALVANLVMDHVIPLARGGRHAIGNIAAACVTCNSAKTDLFVSEWRHSKMPPIRGRGRRRSSGDMSSPSE